MGSLTLADYAPRTQRRTFAALKLVVMSDAVDRVPKYVRTCTGPLRIGQSRRAAET